MSLPLPAAEAVALALPSMASSQLSHRPPFLKDAFYWPLTQNLSSVTLDLKGYYRELFSELDIPCPQGIYHSTVKRQAEYLASRWLAREIFSHYGIEDFILSNGRDRAPQWPDGYSGSLSHSDGQIFLITDPGADYAAMMSSSGSLPRWRQRSRHCWSALGNSSTWQNCPRLPVS